MCHSILENMHVMMHFLGGGARSRPCKAKARRVVPILMDAEDEPQTTIIGGVTDISELRGVNLVTGEQSPMWSWITRTSRSDAGGDSGLVGSVIEFLATGMA